MRNGCAAPRTFKTKDEELLFAKEKALRLLGDMDRTRKELTDRLLKAGCGEDVVQQTLAYLSRYSYVDDERYARSYLSRYTAERGRKRIRMELLQKGVPTETLEAVFADTEDAEAERERAAALARKRAAGLDLSSPRDRNRLLGFLVRRGFREGDAYMALRELLNEADLDDPAEL